MAKAKDVFDISARIGSQIDYHLEQADESYSQMVDRQFDKPRAVFDSLKDRILEKGESASVEELEQCFVTAITRLDELHSNSWQWAPNYYDLMDFFAESLGIEENVSNYSVLEKKE